jgi:hypothetical protein
MRLSVKRNWSYKRFGFDYAPDQISGFLYAAVTAFGVSVILFGK